MAGISGLGICSAVGFAKFVSPGALGRIMTRAATSDGFRRTLILKSLIIVGRFAAWDHGVGASVACRAKKSAMTL